jgi:hypothetical protein
LNRILLINPGHDETHTPEYMAEHARYRPVHRDPPPMSVMTYGTWLQDQGNEVDILDTHIDTDWRPKLSEMLRRDYAWVGLTVIIGRLQANAREITEAIRVEAPRLPVVWGGVMCSVMPDELREAYHPDMVVSGGLRPDSIDRVNWGLVGDRFNKQQDPYYHMIMTSTGCPYSCSFCYKHSISSDGRVRYRSVEAVTSEMDNIHAYTGGRVFAIGDDNFLTNKTRAKAILAHCRERGYYLEEAIGHIEGLSDDMIEAMRGVVHMFIFSIETVSPQLQDIINKQIHLDMVPWKLERLREAGILCNVSFMVGLPGEGQADIDANWAYMEDLRKAHPFIRGNCYLWFPLPKTRLTAYAQVFSSKSFTFPVQEYEKANFWVKDRSDLGGHRFRPHLTEKQYECLVDYGLAFNTAFKYPEGTVLSITDEILAGKEPSVGRAL